MEEKYSCLLFGEGKKEKKFLNVLRGLENFQHKTNKWNIRVDSASGGHPKDLLDMCIRLKNVGEYAVCFFDTDKLEEGLKTRSLPGKLKKVKVIKIKLDNKAWESGVIIIWQECDLEEEQLRVIGSKHCNKPKNKINNLAIKKFKDFINTPYYIKMINAFEKFEDNIT